ncbi:MAG: alpha/beta hydrolase [Tissierellia bacterium]|nr:alpha/beta hydrolase [Tissierellia bacterium]
MKFNFETTISDIPTLILTGEREKRIMKKSAEKTSKLIKGSKYYIAKGAGHGIPYENPDIFNELIINFVSNNPIGEVDGIVLQEAY